MNKLDLRIDRKRSIGLLAGRRGTLILQNDASFEGRQRHEVGDGSLQAVLLNSHKRQFSRPRATVRGMLKCDRREMGAAGPFQDPIVNSVKFRVQYGS